MQLVGATEGFIRRPLLSRSILQGIVSALIAIGMLMVMIYLAIDQIPELLELQDPLMLLFLVVLIVLLGVFISWISTYFAVRKYLRIRTDLLYT
jgi:cell division transport system permease protein